MSGVAIDSRRELSSEAAASPTEEVVSEGKRGDFRRITSGEAAAGDASSEELSELISDPIISSKTSRWEDD